MLQFLLQQIADPYLSLKVEELYENYHNQMIRYARKIMFRRGWSNYHTDAEDVVQISYQHILDYGKILPNLECEEIKPYFVTVVKKTVAEFFKENKMIDSIDDYLDFIDIADENDFFEKLRIQDRYEATVAAIKKLNSIYQTTLLLTRDMTVKEIAKYMGIKEKTAYTRIERARKLLMYHIRGGKENK